MDTRARALEVLEAGHLMSLATMDESGVWVADVIYIFDDDFTIYWMSNPEVRHSQALLKEAQVAGAITANLRKEPNFGLQFVGTATKIDGPRYDLAKKHYAKRGHDAPQEADDVLRGNSWYQLKPAKIELIDEANFYYEKQHVEP